MASHSWAFLPADERAALDETRDDAGLRPQTPDEAHRHDEILWQAHALSGPGGWVASPIAWRAIEALRRRP